MKLPFRSGKDKQARPKPVRGPSAANIRRFSLRSQMLLLILVGILLIVVPPAVVYLQTVLELKEAEQKQSELSASMFASSFRQWVDRQAATAELVSKDPQLARLLTDGNEEELTARAESLAYLFPSSVRVRLLPPGMEEVDLEASPPISYAALEMLKHSETQDTPPPVEVHMSGTPQQHINLVRRILDPSGRRIVGNLMVSFSVQQLQKLLAHGEVDGYVELQQVAGATPLVLGNFGSADSRQGAPDSLAPILGSRWRVAYWSSDQARLGSSVLMTTAGLASGVAAILLAVLVWFVFRKVGLALGKDQATLLTIVKDMNEGRVKPGYSSVLVEMHDTVELMARAASAGAARAASGAAVREGPAKSSSRPEDEAVVDEVSADLLFDESALDISRVDAEEIKSDPGIFRAYDIRGIVGETLSVELAFDIGRAIGSEAYYRGEQTVVVGRDGRLSGPDMTTALIRGLLATGRDVKDIGQVPTPVLYFAAQYLGGNSGVMVTGSHNPKDYNGFKIVLGGETLANEAIDSLRQRIESGDMLTGEGSVEEVDVLPDYIERVKSDVQLVRPIKVVVDCGNGVAGEAAPKLLRELGCEVVELFCEIDGNFPNHHPDPGKTENLAALIQAVQEQGAELGIAFDGDGDRIGVISSQGEIIWPDRLLMLLAIDVLSRNPGAQIIYDVKSSRHVADVVAEHGGEPLMWATGHSLIKAKMKETGALLAGEMSGHIFFKERWFGFDDALYSAARLLEILANQQSSSSDLFATLPDSMNTPELSVPMAEGEPARYMEKLLNGAHFENARIATVDGLRVEFERGWGLVRASNTTPSLVLRFEADDELALSTIQDEFRRVMLQIDPGLSLPF
ncbi:MAG: phosphomannomutase/phosphoglucomutase [Gammaproteobacteria bacterium]|nr:MAG: phosphomannomutase/phosphoglucomutase [Gammaproteobacteria bacterium]